MMLQAIASFFCGFVFTLGLAISGMTQPAKVVGFLDVLGNWDTTLVFVMASAVGVYYIAFQVITRRKIPILAPRFLIPTRTDLDFRSIAGGVMFGVGWGISGLCPGPVLATLGTGTSSVIVMMGFMLAGFYLSNIIGQPKK